MATQLFAGSLATFDTEDSMAREIERAVQQTMGLPPADPVERRRFFIAIARGVIQHLKQAQAAFDIAVTVGTHSTVHVHPDIQVKP